MTKLNFFIILLSIYSCTSLAASRVELPLDGHPIHVGIWAPDEDTKAQEDLDTVVLLSGPIDSWHSDSAWWAAITPQLSKTHRVIALDRAGTVLAAPSAPVGYSHFAKDLHLALTQLKVRGATLVAFASSNISVQLYLHAQQQQQAISRVILIDPDVLTDFSISRYAADTRPFKDNLEKYQAYITEQKYTPRVKQKNQQDWQHLKHLRASDPDHQVDWQYVEDIFARRLEITNQLNLFQEIARYQQDLTLAASTNWPKDIPLTIIDTDFETGYIEQVSEDKDKQGILAWQQDATDYYQTLVAESDQGRYIATQTKAHLYQFEKPQALIDLIVEIGAAD